MGFLVDDGGSVFYAVAHFASEFAADKGGDALNQLRIELIGFSFALFGQPALPLRFFGTVLLPLGMVPFDFAADGASVAVELFGDFGDGAVAGQVLDMVSFVLGQLCVAHGNLSCRKGRYATAYRPFSVMESRTSNPNPRSSENPSMHCYYL